MMDFDFSGSGLPKLSFEKELPAGENNHSYVYSGADGQRYVVRRKKKFSTTGPLQGERDMLLFLEDAGIGFAPRSLFFDAGQGIHVISYVSGNDIRPFEFDSALAGLFAKQLAQLHAIPYADYEAWCRQAGVAAAAPETLEKNLQLYFTGPAAFVKEKCPDKTLVKWADETVGGWIAQARARPQYPATFVHGDLGGNMKWDGKNLVFIDWERARYLHLGELGYIFVHGECPEPIQRRITEAYADARGQDLDEVTEQAEFEMGLLRVDKVLWRANKYTELFAAGEPDAGRYRDMALAALAEFD